MSEINDISVTHDWYVQNRYKKSYKKIFTKHNDEFLWTKDHGIPPSPRASVSCQIRRESPM